MRKWSVDAEKCFGFWVGQNSDCSICIRVCPYNKDFSKWWKVVAPLGALAIGLFVAAVPFIGLPVRVEENTDSIVSLSPRVEKHEGEVEEILCLLKLTFEEGAPSTRAVLDCG